jgi:hypothetical protein
MHISAALPERRTKRSNSRSSGSLLFPQLSAGTRDIAAGFSRGRTLTRVGHEISHCRMNQRLVEGNSENGIGQLRLADLFIL